MAAFGPGLDAAIEHADPLATDVAPAEPEVVEHPPQARRDPAADIVIADDDRTVADPGCGHALAERRGGGERVAARSAQPARVREVFVQVQEERAWNVALEIRGPPGAGLAQVPAQIDDHRLVASFEPPG